ncbi:hypothetical protein QL285_073596 [Trifolium repens]|nr:hypothetical protein QL285_073596 [Trifolium repens]
MSQSHITSSSSSSGSPSHDNIPNSNQPQQEPSNFQWPYPPQNATQAPWTQIPHPQQGYSPLPFWSPQPFGANYIPPIFQTVNAPCDPSTYLAMPYQLQVNASYLAQMHELQQSWEAQLMENAELWSTVNKLYAEIFYSNDRVYRLQEEVSSLKHEFERRTNEIVRTTPVGTRQPRKRGRQREQSLSSEEALYESD